MFSNLTQHFKKQPAPAFPAIDEAQWRKAENDHGAAPISPRVPPRIDLGDAKSANPLSLDTRYKPPFEQPRSNLAGFFAGLRQAADRFAMQHIAPLAALDPSVRFQLRTVTVRVKPENDRLLRELQALEHHIIKTAAVNCLKQGESAEQIDLTEFFGIIIAAGDEVAAGDVVMTLATVGVERINMEFEFAGEHISVSQSRPAAATPAREIELSLRLVQADGRSESVPLTDAPLLIGTSPRATLRVAGTYDSREHATLYFDNELNCWVLQDHSRHGTWVNGKPLRREGRCLLHGSGQIHLASSQPSDATLIEFSHPALDLLEPTPLFEVGSPLEALAATPVMNPMPHEARPVEAAVPESTPAPVPVPTSTPEPTPIRPAAVSTLSAQETQLCEAHEGPALAWLQVRTLEGLRTLPITALPFVIGREPKDSGFHVDERASFVSREHLKLVSYHHNCFTIENGGLGRNNTYKKGVLQDSRFLYQPVPADSDSGWVVLGGHRLDEKSIEVRLLNACPGAKR